jgi:predicted RNA binding protein YcfA (HicA-like mRNA interferase family)
LPPCSADFWTACPYFRELASLDPSNPRRRAKKYPALTYAESASILKARGFYLKKTKGGHEHWEGNVGGVPWKVTHQVGGVYSILDITSHIRQSELSREEYYGAAQKTAKKIGL